jgi:hypothetical protein
MVIVILLIFWALVFSLVLSKIKKGKGAEWAKLFRIATLVFSISFFTYWFIKKSAVGIVENSVALQVINKLPQPLDFYVINLNDPDANKAIETKHIGKSVPNTTESSILEWKSPTNTGLPAIWVRKILFIFHNIPFRTKI